MQLLSPVLSLLGQVAGQAPLAPPHRYGEQVGAMPALPAVKVLHVPLAVAPRAIEHASQSPPLQAVSQQ